MEQNHQKMDQQGSKKRKRPHASKACNGCRRRRSRCDGAYPACSSCVSFHDICSYDESIDGRRNASKNYVDALLNRIKTLEDLLKAKGESQEPPKSSVSDSDDSRTEKGLVSSNKLTGLDSLGVDHETGHQYGPTSAFIHLPQGINRESSTLSGSEELHPKSEFGSPPSLLNLEYPIWPSFPDADRPAWATHLPVIPNFDEQLHSELLDYFFRYYNMWRWVNEEYFRRDLALCTSPSSKSSRTSHYSPMLHNALLGIAVNYSDDDRVKTHPYSSMKGGYQDNHAELDAGGLFIAKAKEYFERECERPMLSTIQGLLGMASYYSGNARQSLGWLYCGNALRLCKALGLNLDCSSWVERGLITEEVRKERIRVFWITYAQDKLWCLYVGRSPSISSSGFDTPLPAIDPEEDTILWHPNPPHIINAQDSGPNNLRAIQSMPSNMSTAFYWLCKLMVLADKVLNLLSILNSSGHTSFVIEKYSAINLELEAWMTDCPQMLQLSSYSTKPMVPQVYYMHLTYWFIMIQLHRPFFKKSGDIDQLSSRQCKTAASKIVYLLKRYHQCHGLRYVNITLVQVVFAAGTVHLLLAVSSDYLRAPKRYQEAYDAARQCVNALREMGRTFKGSTQCGEILEHLIREWCDSVNGSGAKVASNISNTCNQSNEFMGDNSTKNSSEVKQNLSDMLQNNDGDASSVIKQLIALGWTPPTQLVNGVTPESSSSSTSTSSSTAMATTTTVTASLNTNGVHQHPPRVEPPPIVNSESFDGSPTSISPNTNQSLYQCGIFSFQDAIPSSSTLPNPSNFQNPNDLLSAFIDSNISFGPLQSGSGFWAPQSD